MNRFIFQSAALLVLGVFLTSGQALDVGEVAIYTGNVGWISKAGADAQAGICQGALEGAGISTVWFQNAADDSALADWVMDSTDNGMLDVLVLYGYFPPVLYPAGNAQPDGSIAELFIESTDGDMILNHADYMFYVSNPNNGDAGCYTAR